MLQVAETVEDELEGLERRIEGHDNKLSGRLRVTMVDALATNLLMPQLTEFTERYPEIDLEVQVSYVAADLDRREAYASRDYLSSHDLQDPTSARWIGFAAQGAYPKWVRKSAYPDIPARGQFVSLLVQLAACKAGMGVAMLPCFLGEQQSSLRRLSPAKPDPFFEL